MTQEQMFMALFFSVILGASGVREIRLQHYGIAVALIAVPVCYWLSLWLGRTPQ